MSRKGAVSRSSSFAIFRYRGQAGRSGRCVLQKQGPPTGCFPAVCSERWLIFARGSGCSRRTSG